MKKKTVIIGALAAVMAAGGAFVLKNDPDVLFTAVNTVKNITANVMREPLEEADGTPVRSVAVAELAANGAELNDCLMLVNDAHRLPEDHIPDIVNYKDTDVLFESHTAQAYAGLSAEVEERFGEKLYVSSTYRTAEEQQELYDEQGADTAQQPGASEHQTGLAADVYVPYFAGEGFIKSEAGRWVNENCWKYGFIVRYPAGKKSITGISYEPWHLRYVGKPNAEIIMRNGLTLEEYADFLGEGFRSCSGESGESFLISHQTDAIPQIPESFSSCEVSPDGCGGWYVTARK